MPDHFTPSSASGASARRDLVRYSWAKYFDDSPYPAPAESRERRSEQCAEESSDRSPAVA